MLFDVLRTVVLLRIVVNALAFSMAIIANIYFVVVILHVRTTEPVRMHNANVLNSTVLSTITIVLSIFFRMLENVFLIIIIFA